CAVSLAQDPADFRVITERKLLNQEGPASPHIYEIEMKPKALRNIQTALNYFTVIDLPRKVLNVYIGNQELFKVEVYEKQVLIKPVTADMTAQTNLLVITESGRFVFDSTVGPPETAEFVIDGLLGEDILEETTEKAIKEKETVLNEKYQTKEKELEKQAGKIADQKITDSILLESKVINLRVSKANRDIQVNLLSLSKMGSRMYLDFRCLISQKPRIRCSRL
ncbi:MAG: hypothetical protein HZC17_02040, partial [Candidatus Omnitrophica bacterium]|nr:hypothetical protein [Candidatus Omnitrophota bacterium]